VPEAPRREGSKRQETDTATQKDEEMNWFNKIKIDIQRWNFRRKRKHEDKVDVVRQLEAIEKAEKLSQKRKSRLWVIRVEPGKYVIRSKSDVKAILRRLGLKGRIDLFSINDTVVHITK
jgi:hypothetical protein